MLLHRRELQLTGSNTTRAQRNLQFIVASPLSANQPAILDEESSFLSAASSFLVPIKKKDRLRSIKLAFPPLLAGYRIFNLYKAFASRSLSFRHSLPLSSCSVQFDNTITMKSLSILTSLAIASVAVAAPSSDWNYGNGGGNNGKCVTQDQATQLVHNYSFFLAHADPSQVQKANATAHSILAADFTEQSDSINGFLGLKV